jgi:predicted aldo/keto reductase-like oxidoreductase
MIDRREFVLAAAATGTAHAAASGPIPKRPYKDGVELSIIGFGGIVVTAMPQSEADRRVAAAFERGVNYYDCAPSYADGEAEIQLGNALKPYRAKAFLAEKSQKRDAKGAQAELEQTLRRFHTDHVDLYQFHAVGSMEDVEKILAPGGAAETFVKAKKEGKTRFLGFSAHHAEAAIKLMDALPLDSVLFPVSFSAWDKGSFGPQILAKAKQKGMARMALKALARGRWPESLARSERKYPKCWYQPIDDKITAQLALRFALNQEITAAVPPGDEQIFDLALDLAAMPLPKLSRAELAQLRSRVGDAEPIFRA